MNISRQPSGQPTGGQFAESARASADIALVEERSQEVERCSCGVLLDPYADPNVPDMCTYCTDEEIGEGPYEKDADAYGTDVTEPFIPVSTIEGLAQDGDKRTIYLTGGDTLEYRDKDGIYRATIKDIADRGFDGDPVAVTSFNPRGQDMTKDEHYRTYSAQKHLYENADLNPDNGYVVYFSTPTTLNIAPCMDSYQGDVTPEAVSIDMDEHGQITGGSVETEWGTVPVDAEHAESIVNQAESDMGSTNLRESVIGAISRAHQ